MDMKHVGGKVSFGDCELLCGDMNPVLADIMEAAVSNMLRDDPPYISMPIIWEDTDGHEGPPVTDPLMIHVWLGALGGESGPYFGRSFADIALDIYEATKRTGRPYNEPAVPKIIDALRALADRLESLISKPG